MAMRNSIHDVVDVQSLVTRNQLSMLQYCTVYIDGLVQDCNNSSDNALELLHSCTKPSISRYESYRMLLWGINIVFWVFGMLLRVIVAGTLLRVVIVLWQISGFNIKITFYEEATFEFAIYNADRYGEYLNRRMSETIVRDTVGHIF